MKQFVSYNLSYIEFLKQSQDLFGRKIEQKSKKIARSKELSFVLINVVSSKYI